VYVHHATELMDLNGEKDKYIETIRDFSTPLSTVNRTTGKKINEVVEKLNIINQHNLFNIRK
jgi:hypothetical protein